MHNQVYILSNTFSSPYKDEQQSRLIAVCGTLDAGTEEMLKRVDPSWRKGFEWNKEWDGSEERLFAYAGDYW
jgi:hypothetical protein